MQNDQRNCRNVFKQVLAKDSLKKRRKIWKYMNFRRIRGDIIRLRIKPYGEGIPKYILFYNEISNIVGIFYVRLSKDDIRHRAGACGGR